jgi:hypothetical protein
MLLRDAGPHGRVAGFGRDGLWVPFETGTKPGSARSRPVKNRATWPRRSANFWGRRDSRLGTGPPSELSTSVTGPPLTSLTCSWPGILRLDHLYPQGDEQLELRWMPFADAVLAVMSGEITESGSVAAILRRNFWGGKFSKTT